MVVEAGETSGTLFTAEIACRLGREIGSRPGEPATPVLQGSNALLRDGAQLVLDADDVLGLVGGAMQPSGV